MIEKNDNVEMDLELIVEDTINQLEQQFYSKPYYFSYSSISKLLWNPAVFYQLYVLKNRQEDSVEKHLVNGKVIHCLLLEPQNFDSLYLVSPDNLPTGNLKLVVDKLYKKFSGSSMLNHKSDILDIMKEMDYHQSLKTDEARLGKILGDEAYNYWDYLHKRATLTLIDKETYEFCKNAVEIIKSNGKVCELIGCSVTEFDNKEVFNELYIEADNINLPDCNTGFKGYIDNVVIDHDTMKIMVNDIKTTAKELKNFPETLEYFNYWLQAVIYMILVGKKFEDLIFKGYQIEFRFIVIDNMFNVYPFFVTVDTLNKWIDRFTEVMKKVCWHYNNQNYGLPYDFANNLITL